MMHACSTYDLRCMSQDDIARAVVDTKDTEDTIVEQNAACDAVCNGCHVCNIAEAYTQSELQRQAMMQSCKRKFSTGFVCMAASLHGAVNLTMCVFQQLCVHAAHCKWQQMLHGSRVVSTDATNARAMSTFGQF